MTALRVDDYLLSLTAAVAAIAELALDPPVDGRRDLFAHQAHEPTAREPWSVIRIYGAPVDGSLSPRHQVSVQVASTGSVASVTLRRAWQIYAALHDDAGLPRCHWVIPGRRKSAAGGVEADPDGDWEVRVTRPLQGPGITGRDASGRWTATFNFDQAFFRRPAG